MCHHNVFSVGAHHHCVGKCPLMQGDLNLIQTKGIHFCNCLYLYCIVHIKMYTCSQHTWGGLVLSLHVRSIQIDLTQSASSMDSSLAKVKPLWKARRMIMLQWFTQCWRINRRTLPDCWFWIDTCLDMGIKTYNDTIFEWDEHPHQERFLSQNNSPPIQAAPQAHLDKLRQLFNELGQRFLIYYWWYIYIYIWYRYIYIYDINNFISFHFWAFVWGIPWRSCSIPCMCFN